MGIPISNLLEVAVDMAATPTEREMAYATGQFLQTLSRDQSSKTKAGLMEVCQKLEQLFNFDVKKVDDFLDNDYGSDLPEIMNAGVSALRAGMYEDDLKEAREDEYFASYNSVIAAREYFVGAPEGSLEYLRRKSRVLAKFREHCPKTDLSIDNPAHPLRTAFIKTTGRWPWANEKPNIVPTAPKMDEGAESRKKLAEEEELKRRRQELEEAERRRIAAEAAEAAEAAAAAKAPPKPPPETPEEHISQSKFIETINTVDTSRDYIIIVDKSASMKLGGRWKAAEEAVKVLSPAACKCDEDGITLYFFSSHSKTSKGDFRKYRMLFFLMAFGGDV